MAAVLCTPGAGVSKELPLVGEIFINGIVNVSGFWNICFTEYSRAWFSAWLGVLPGIYYTALALRQGKKPSGSKNTEAAR